MYVVVAIGVLEDVDGEVTDGTAIESASLDSSIVEIGRRLMMQTRGWAEVKRNTFGE